MSNDPVRPLHFHETAPTERRRINSVAYLLLLGAVGALVIAAFLGLG